MVDNDAKGKNLLDWYNVSLIHFSQCKALFY